MSDFTTVLEIQDEGSGEFVFVQQPYANQKLLNGGIAINPGEWPEIKRAIDIAFKEIKHAENPEPMRSKILCENDKAQ